MLSVYNQFLYFHGDDMENPYKKLFATRGTLAFSIAGMIARMPISMMGIGIITMLSQIKESYWLAGGVAATFTLAMALIAPQISRAVDHFGQSKVLPITTGISVIATCSLVLCTYKNAPEWTLFIFAALAGFMPSMPAMIRARWTHIYRNTSSLHTAYSLESVLDEVCFILGPPISVGLSVTLFPEAGPLMSAILLGIGVFAFVLQKQTEPAIAHSATKIKSSALKPLTMKILVFSLIALGVIVGTIDVISVAFAKELGKPIAASIVLSTYAVGSCSAGLIFGVIKLKTPLAKQFFIASLATAIMTVPLLGVNDVFTLSLTVFIAGVFFAPTMIIAMNLVANIVPKDKLTEGLTWMITGLGIGVALGATIAGWCIDVYGIKTAFIVTIMAGLSVLLIAAINYHQLENNSIQKIA